MKYIKTFEDFLVEDYFILEDWFDDYLEYEDKVFNALSKRFDILQSQKDQLAIFFGKKLERGYKKNIDPNKLALQIVPRGKKISITKWGN